MTSMRRPAGFAAFTIIWLGQIVSAIGTRMTAFALGLYVWAHTGRVLDFAFLEFFNFGATVLLSPVAGALVDRWNRRLTIIMSDAGSLCVTAALLVLFLVAHVGLWPLYLVSALTGAFASFQYPAYSAIITVMLARGHYPRANAMMTLVRNLPYVAAPALAASLLTVGGIKPVLAIDTASYAVAIGTVFLVAIPPRAPAESQESPRMWRDSLFGFRYIAARTPLLSLLTASFLISFVAAITWTVMTPMVLAKTGNSAAAAGIVQTVGAVGGILGGVFVAVVGSRGDKVRYILGAAICMGIFRIVYGASGSILLWSLSLLVGWATLPVIDGYSQSIWQEKVANSVQGRVFAAQMFVENLSLPVALVLSGILADQVFGPAMRPHGSLAPLLGGLTGTGPGAGMAAMCVLGGLIAVVIGIGGFLVPWVRRAESLLQSTPQSLPEESGAR